MEFRNLPTDWDVPHIVVGHGIEFRNLVELLKAIREVVNGEATWAVYADSDLMAVDAIVEFFPLGTERGD